MQAGAEIRARVLVMDPDRARRACRCGQITAAAWQAVPAGDTAEALAAVRAGDVDAAVLHVSPDEAEATDLPRVLRLVAGTPHLPVVVLAGEVVMATRCRFLDTGSDAILPEAISGSELTSQLRALLRVKFLQDELAASREALAESLHRERALLAQLRRDNAHLLTLATTDPLTHVQNVRHFDSVLDGEFKICRRYNRRLSVLVFDLDHFKVVNDTYGHPSGDYVLKEFAVILRQQVRDSDVVARTGGEEFSILLPDAGRAQARRMAERIRKAVAERHFLAFGQDMRITTSIGTASYPEDPEVTEPSMLVYFADQALLAAKQRGRDQVVGFHQLEIPVRADLRKKFRASQPPPPRGGDNAPPDVAVAGAELLDARR